MARRRVSLHGLWQQAGIGESFLRRRDEIQAASSTTNKLHCSCSGCERVPSTSVVTRPSICLFQPARRLGSCLYRSAFSHLPLLLHLRHLTPAPASGTANASQLLCHGLVVRPIIIRLVLLLGSAFLTFRISLAPCWLRRRRHQHEQQCHCATFTGPCAIGSNHYLTLVNCIYWRSCLSGGGGRPRTLQTMSPLQTTPVRLEEAIT